MTFTLTFDYSLAKYAKSNLCLYQIFRTRYHKVLSITVSGSQASRNFDILCQDASSSSASEKGRLGSAPNVQSCSFPQLSAEKIEKGLNMTNSYDKRYDMNRYDMMITEFGSLHL